MTFDEWKEQVPQAITGDALWRLEVDQVALFLGDLAWHDATRIREERWYGLADQLHRATGSISANIAEGFGRPTSKDQTRFYGIALGSARESRDWYFKARHLLGKAVTSHRLHLLEHLIRQLLNLMRVSGRRFQESSEPYSGLDSTEPVPFTT